MFEKRILNIYVVLTGVLFIISGVGKVIDTYGFSNLIYQYGLGYLMILSPLIVLFEILLGLVLVLLINPKRYAMISFFLMIVFTVLFAYAHFKNGVTDCGCFGSVQHTSLPPVFSFIRNFILIGMLFIVWKKYPEENTPPAPWKRRFILTVMFISIFTAGFTFETPFFLRGKPVGHEFQNQNIRNVELSNYTKTSPDSTYLFFCFSYTCPYCLNSIENLRQYQKSNAVDRVVVFAVGETKDRLIFEQNFQPDFPINELSGQAMDKLTKAYPTAFYVERDTIKVIIQSELPSPFVFKKIVSQSDIK